MPLFSYLLANTVISVNSSVIYFFFCSHAVSECLKIICAYSQWIPWKIFIDYKGRAFFCLNSKLQSGLWPAVTVKLPLTAQTCNFPLDVVLWKSWYRTTSTPVLFITVCWLPVGFTWLSATSLFISTAVLRAHIAILMLEFGSVWCDLVH